MRGAGHSKDVLRLSLFIIKLLTIPDSAEQRKYSRNDEYVLHANKRSDHTANDSRQNHALTHRPLGERLLFFRTFVVFPVPHPHILLKNWSIFCGKFLFFHYITFYQRPTNAIMDSQKIDEKFKNIAITLRFCWLDVCINLL